MSSLFQRRRPSAASVQPDTDAANGRASTLSTHFSARTRSEATPTRRRMSAFGSLLSPRSEEPEPELDPLLSAQYAIPDHVEAFRDALSHDLGQSEYLPAAAHQITGSSTWSMLGFPNSLKSPDASSAKSPQAESQRNPFAPDAAPPTQANLAEPSATQAANPRKVGRIAAASDFAPIREKVHRKKKKHRHVDSGTREGFVYHTLRWPLLVGIFLTIFLEFAAYVLTRQIVNVIEYAIAWRGRKGELRKRMRRSTSQAEWKEAALELDEYLGFESWKVEDASGFYDWILVKKVKASLKAFREKEDAENLLGVLDLCLRNNFAGTENFRLYSETFFGTKYLVESYLSELELALRYIEQTDKISLEVKRQFYRTVARNLGRSALCLSGGASFGYYHVGVVRALLDSNLLPKVVTGTSAGGLIAALTCTRTEEELKRLLVPALADRITACEEPFSVWARRAWETGARFDMVQWAEKCAYFTMGSMTFKEAYERTGKVLCISVIPADRHSPVKLLNYITAPDCVIWSSLLASAAVPGILNPVCLMQKTKEGRIVPWNWGHRFKDGSLRVDIPLQDLHALFNVNYPIVSQVNPHVHLFHFGSKGAPGRPTAHRKGKGWRGGFVLSAAEHVLKLHLKMNFKIIRDLDLLPAILGQDWSSVFLQPFGGAVTIWPKTRAWDWVRILTDPDRRELERMIGVGQIVTFPKLHMVENRIRLEKAIERGRKACRRQLKGVKTANASASAATARSALVDSAGSAGGGSAGATPQDRAVPLPTAGSLPSDTEDNDDFFSSKKVPVLRGLGGTHDGDATAPAALSVFREEPASPVAAGTEPHADAPRRPKPYPTYSRYLLDARGGEMRGDAEGEEDADVRGLDGARRMSESDWLDRAQDGIGTRPRSRSFDVDAEPAGKGKGKGKAFDPIRANGHGNGNGNGHGNGNNGTSSPLPLLQHRRHPRYARQTVWGNGSSWDDRSYSGALDEHDEARLSASSSSSSSDEADEGEGIRTTSRS